MEKFNEEVKIFHVEYLKVGIISDSQITPCAYKKNTYFENNLKKSFETLKENNCNMIIFAGDICNFASKSAYEKYNACLDETFGDDKPIMQNIMGNHDYYITIKGNKYYRNLFRKCVGQDPLTHYVVNGYHFIGASPWNCSMKDAYGPVISWMEKHIEMAIKDDPSKPIFVTTHNAPLETVYGSDDWGDIGLNDLFIKYPQVINISGHLHYSLLDERAFYSNTYQAISSQSTSYVELERGKLNGTIPPMAYDCPMGYILDFKDGDVFAHRLDLKRRKEVKSNMLWRLYPKENRNIIKSTPTFKDLKCKTEIIDNRTIISFKNAIDSDFIHSYKIIVNDSTEQLYFSDFYMGVKSKDEQNITLYNLPKGIYNIKVYAINSLGICSDNYIEIENVKILKKIKYKMVQAPDKRFARI